MSAAKNAIVVIPARMHSTRLPGKPLADIGGAPMIVQVCRRACEAALGPVVVAAGEREIVDAVEAAGGTALLTDPDHPSGSDRVYEAVCRFDADATYDAIINLQGDLPTIEPSVVRAVADALDHEGADIATAAAEITNPAECADPNVVKAVAGFAPDARVARALYFTRTTAPWGDGPRYHHIGLYAYRRDALARFVAMPPGVLEQREKLEQLRALEAGMRIAVALVDTIPLGVDTPADLERARAVLTR